MAKNKSEFIKLAEQKAFDEQHRQKIQFNIGKYDKAVERGKKQYINLDLMNQWAKNTKWKAIAQLDQYLLQFEKKFTQSGGKVIWARDAKEAFQEIWAIVQAKQAKTIVKSKSMVTEEIDLNQQLEQRGVEVVETDLGEYIVQLADEKPYHIVTPAMHKSKEDVAALFHEKLNSPKDATPQQLTAIARQQLRQKYVAADIGITGGNFIVADVGGIALTENEGNARLTTAYPKTHIAIIGIEKIIPSLQDWGHFLPLLATYGTGQQLTVYNTLLLGPKQAQETDGPEEMYVILLDNGRTDLLADPKMREALYCIRCGACLNACPVYQTIGGHAYQTTYSGPIGAVISPYLEQKEKVNHLSHASSICGKCKDVCPVNLDIPNMLLHNRKKQVEQGNTNWQERMAWQLWEKAMLDRNFMNKGGSKMKNLIFRWLFKNSWGKHRTLPQIAKKSFNEQWTEKRIRN